MRWLHETGAITTQVAQEVREGAGRGEGITWGLLDVRPDRCCRSAQGIDGLRPHLVDGTLICWLVQEVTGVVLRGVNQHTAGGGSAAARRNWMRAIEVLRAQNNMAKRWELGQRGVCLAR